MRPSAMPRFVFTTHDGTRQVDADILDLPNLVAAREAALNILMRVALDLLQEPVGNMRLETRVDTEDGRPVYRVSLTITGGLSEG